MYIALDFDGTCVTHEFPKVGKDIGAVPVLKDLVDKGHKLILHTMRAKGNDGIDYLQPAVKWFEDNGIPLFGVNHNPTQDRWTTSLKAFAHIYIDDAALGCPLITSKLSERPYVDWVKVKELLKIQEIL